MHDLRIVHRDVKPENVLLADRKKKKRLLVIDTPESSGRTTRMKMRIITRQTRADESSLAVLIIP